MEGAAAPKRVAINEWDSVEQAQAYYNSQAWKDAVRLLQVATAVGSRNLALRHQFNVLQRVVCCLITASYRQHASLRAPQEWTFASNIASATHMSDGCVAMQASLLPRIACMRLWPLMAEQPLPGSRLLQGVAVS
jgi:Domain of unknown function (DUF1330)